MNHNLLHGEKVRLCADNPEVRAEKFSCWNQDSEWLRLLDTDPPWMLSEKKWKERLEKELDREVSSEIFFSIRTLDVDELIGFIGFFDFYQQHGDALVVIALGDRKFWGRGYGTDAMRVLLRYGFNELNLRRAGLIVFEYNPRAIRSYEKVGFITEGCIRGAILREGRRWDWLYMGILREEWLENGIMTG